jgi:nicotinamide-nucleotide amidase
VIREMFARRGREMPERNRVQALFPEMSEPIVNPRGTAPGVWMEVPRSGREACQVAAMPGVPSEMKGMFLDSVLPRLRRPADRAYIRRARINIFGLGESQCEEMLGDLTARGRDPEVGITVHEATITLRIEAHGHSIEQCEYKIDDARRIARERLGEAVFGDEDEELQDIVTRLLRTSSRTLATAEAGTGGLIGSWLSSVPDAACYSGGLVAPSRRELQRVLPGVGDASAATDLAAACRQQFGTDFGLVAFVDDTASPEPRAWVALASATAVEVRDFAFTRDPAIRRAWLSKSALNLLRLHLGGNPGPAGP